MPETKVKTGGLAGIVAGDSSICLCGAEDETLRYRGYSIEDLAAHSSFEEVTWLLTRGELPTKSELERFCHHQKLSRDLPETLKNILETIPASANQMDVMRTACSLLGILEPETPGRGRFEVADRLVASAPSWLLYWWQATHKGRKVSLTTKGESLASHFLELLHGKAEAAHVRALDLSWILYAEHEFNASTFTVRTVASTLSDFYSCIVAGIGALRGPLHGGANEFALRLIEGFKTPQAAEEGVLKLLQRKELVMGFGHRVYTTRDPRSALIKACAASLIANKEDERLYEIAEHIEDTMWKEKKLFPNLDFYSALVYHFCRIPIDMFTPLFVMSRLSGWSAHLLEQRANNKLIRPISNYIGPKPRAWVSLDARV
jgi:2-methylcitrate synthase